MNSHRRRVPFLLIACGTLLFMITQMVFASTNATIEELASQATSTVNMAAYQRTLTQRMLAMSLLMQRYDRMGKAIIGPHAELAAAEHVFDSTLRAFLRGGATDNSAGVRVTVSPLTGQNERVVLGKISSLWTMYRMKIDALGDVIPSSGSIDDLAQSSITAASQLSVLMNDLSEEIQKDSTQEIAELSQRCDALIAFTAIGLLCIIMGFFLHVLASRRQIKRFADDLQERNVALGASAAALAAAKDRQDRIMETVRQGLFLIDGSFVIQDEYSKELEKIFRTIDLKGVKLSDILRRLLSPRMYDTSRDYLGLLFDAGKRERTVVDINPLEEIEVNFPDPKGGFISRYLSFSFRRIVEDRRITRVFIAVGDVTDRVTLERSTRESENRKQRQLELLLSFLRVEPNMQAEFLVTANKQLHEINDALRAIVVAGRSGHEDEELRRRLDTVFRCVHTIKGNAVLFGIDYFRRAAEDFENKIAELRKRGNLSGDDFLVIAVAQAEVRSDLDELQELRRRLGGLRGSQPGQATDEEDGKRTLLESLAALTVDLGHRLRKEVRLDVTAFQMRDLDFEQCRLLKDVLVQVVRNSVAHGIEPPEVRVATGKSVPGVVVVRTLSSEPGSFAFSCRDDGRGMDVEVVRRDVVAQGLASAEEMEKMDDLEAAGFIFSPGFSTVPSSGEAAGRGMGMDIIKQVVVDNLGGTIGLASQPGEFFELTFTIPLRSHSSAVRIG